MKTQENMDYANTGNTYTWENPERNERIDQRPGGMEKLPNEMRKIITYAFKRA